MIWPRRNVRPIGIDFGTSAIRMMQVGGTSGGLTISAAAQSLYPADAGDDRERRSATVAAAREMLSGHGFVGRRVVTALAHHDVLIKNLRLPPIPEEELAAAIRYEASERFGLSDAGTEYRHLAGGTVGSGDQEQQEIAVLAAADEAIRRHLDLVVELGLTVEAVDIGPCAVFRPFERFLRRDADAEAVNAFVDLGRSGTRIMVGRGREIIFVKALDIGGARFDALASERLSVDPQEARGLRRRMANAELGLPEADDEPVSRQVREEVDQAIRPAVEQLGKEISLCLRYCAVTFRGPRCESVTCVGGEASSADLLNHLGEAIGVAARKGHPLRNVSCDGVFSMADQCTGLPEWAAVFGLALKPSAGQAGRMAG